MVFGGFLSVCPIHLHFFFFISFSMGSCLVIFQSVVLDILSVHFRCSILCRHLLMKVCILFNVFCVLGMSMLKKIIITVSICPQNQVIVETSAANQQFIATVVLIIGLAVRLVSNSRSKPRLRFYITALTPLPLSSLPFPM